MSKGNKQVRITTDEKALLDALRAQGLTPYRLRRNLENLLSNEAPKLVAETTIEVLLEREWGSQN